MNHFIVVPSDIPERHPWVAVNLFRAVTESKEISRRQDWEDWAMQRETGLLPLDVAKNLEQDLFPYGLKANAKALNTLADYSCEQGLTPRRVAIEELFAESVLGL